VAVTFTDKAANELRDRVRRELERVAAGPDGGARAAAAAALDELDAAAVSTLHAFAQRLLAEHAIEAGLPPRIEVLDDIASQVAFEERWSRFLDRLLDDPACERALLLAFTVDTSPDTLRTLALACDANWDLVAERIRPEPEPPALDVRGWLASVDAVTALAPSCRSGDDRLLAILESLAAWRARVADAPDEFEALRVAHAEMPSVHSRAGRRENWTGEHPVDDVRAAAVALRDAVPGWIAPVTEGALRRLVWELARFTTTEAEARRREGTLEFHDLLVLARALLRHPEHGEAVRARVRARYTHLLLDEFQDTDPIQCDLAALLASPGPVDGRSWDELAVEPGRLFVVGDPKQSIYRFRRADIAAFLRARAAFGARPQQLTRNFRTAAPVVEFVNHVFADLIVAEDDSQPEYVPLEPTRGAAPTGPPVALLGPAPHDDAPGADALRVAEADDVAAVVATALADGWSVERRQPDGTAVWGPCRLATSPSSCPPAPRSDSSRTPSTPAGSRTGPRPRRSCTRPGRSATCSCSSPRSTTRPTSSPW